MSWRQAQLASTSVPIRGAAEGPSRIATGTKRPRRVVLWINDAPPTSVFLSFDPADLNVAATGTPLGVEVQNVFPVGIVLFPGDVLYAITNAAAAVRLNYNIYDIVDESLMGGKEE